MVLAQLRQLRGECVYKPVAESGEFGVIDDGVERENDQGG